MKDSLYEEIGHVFDQFPRYDKKMSMGDFDAKVCREDIFNRHLGMKVHTKLIKKMELE
jgi:hypothetical protein